MYMFILHLIVLNSWLTPWPPRPLVHSSARYRGNDYKVKDDRVLSVYFNNLVRVSYSSTSLASRPPGPDLKYCLLPIQWPMTISVGSVEKSNKIFWVAAIQAGRSLEGQQTLFYVRPCRKREWLMEFYGYVCIHIMVLCFLAHLKTKIFL